MRADIHMTPLLLGKLIWVCICSAVVSDVLAEPFEFKKLLPDSTKGVELRAVEVERKVQDDFTKVTYEMSFAQFPKDKTYRVFLKTPGTPWSIVAFPDGGTEIVLDEKSAPINPKTREARNFQVLLQKFVKGEWRDYGVKSTDDSVFAAIRIVPFPLEAQDAACRVAMVLGGPTTETYLVEGTGYQPGEEVKVELNTGDRTVQGQLPADADGRISLVVNHAHDKLKGKLSLSKQGKADLLVLEDNRTLFFGKTGGEATLKAAGNACSPVISYQWGTAGKKIQ